MNLSILLADGSANFQALLEDGEGVFCRVGGHAYADGSVLAVLPTAERPTSATLDRLAQEYGLNVFRQMAATGAAAESVS